MLELILAGVIIGAVCAAAVVTGVRDRRRRKADRLAAERDGAPYGEPIPRRLGGDQRHPGRQRRPLSGPRDWYGVSTLEVRSLTPKES